SCFTALEHAPGDWGREVAALVDLLPAQERGLHQAAQLPTGIRRELVTLMERRRLDAELGFGIPHHQVGVAAHSDSALAAQAGQPGWSFAEPARNLRDAGSTQSRF